MTRRLVNCLPTKNPIKLEKWECIHISEREDFIKKKNAIMKLISWNVNGLRACVGKGFSEIFKELDADFFCLQETKMQEGQLDICFEGYKSYWNYAEKKGYSGTAIFTRH